VDGDGGWVTVTVMIGVWLVEVSNGTQNAEFLGSSYQPWSVSWEGSKSEILISVAVALVE